MKVTDRDQLPTLFNLRNYTGKGLEVGVFEGYFASILNKAKTQYHGVDTWQKSNKDEVQKKILGSVFFEANSIDPDFIQKLGDYAPFDWIYLDGDHTYKHVRAELDLYWDLVRPGGILCGHDYVVTGEHPSQPGFVYGVKQAVDEFTTENNLPFSLTSEPHGFLTWMIDKP